MKNIDMPQSTTAMAVQSNHLIFSLSNQPEKRATYIGAVYCSSMALPAVVSLVAWTKRMTVAA